MKPLQTEQICDVKRRSDKENGLASRAVSLLRISESKVIAY